MSRMTIRGVLLVAAALFAGGPAVATPFYLRYDADETYPEQDGWTRSFSDPFGEIRRTLADGVFVLDTLYSNQLHDFYGIIEPGLMPSPGETLAVSWRMRTVQSLPPDRPSDISVSIGNELQAYAEFLIAPDCVMEEGEYGSTPSYTVPITPGVFHDYLFVTADLRSFTLFIDGEFALASLFHSSSWTPGPHVIFGDTHYGARSLSEWDYVDVRVVPEPAAPFLVLLGAVIMIAGPPKRAAVR